MKVAVIGANGQLGTDVCERFRRAGDDVVEVNHADMDVVLPEQVDGALGAVAPDVIVNTAAMHHVEKCEGDPTSAFAVNATGARNLALFCRNTGAVLIHISTDYVFDGGQRQPYRESDVPCPLNVYGNSKLAGELFVRTLAPRHFVLRVSGLYGNHPCRAKGGLNFVDLMLKLAKERPEVRVVNDEWVTPTPTKAVAEQIAALNRSDRYGLYHATAEGACSWFEFAREIFDLCGIDVRLSPARPGEFPAKVPRPQYSVLENAALKACGLNVFSDWREGLREYLNSRVAAAV